MRILTGPKLQFRQLLFSPDGSHLAGVGHSSSGGDVALVWAVHGDGEPLHVLNNDDQRRPYIGALAFSPDGQRVLTCHDRRRWFALEVDGGQEILEDRLSALNPVAVSEDGRWAACVGYDDHDHGVIRLAVIGHDDGRWNEAWERTVRFADPDVRIYDHSDEGFELLRFWPDGSSLTLGFRQRAESDYADGPMLFRVLQTATGSVESEWRGKVSRSAYLLAVGPNGQGAFFLDRSFEVIDFSQPDLPPLRRAWVSGLSFSSAAFSPDGRFLATTTGDTTVTFWDTATYQPVRRHGWKIGRLRAVAFAPDGLTCAAGSDTGQVVLWDVDE